VNYRTYQPGLMNTALQDPYGQAFQRSLGIVKDYLLARTKTAVQQRFPSLAVPDAIGAIGNERKIDQGNDIQLSPAETPVAYAARLRDAWNIWMLGGAAWGMLKAFAAQGYFPQLVCQNGLYYSVDTGLNLSITQGPSLSFPLWTEFFVWFNATPSSWSSIVVPPTPSSVPSIYELRKFRHNIIDRWKPAWAKCVGIGVLTSGTGGILGSPGVVLGEMGLTLGGGTFVWFSASDELELGFPPGPRTLGSGYTLGQQV
jgi:hypothetical protein